ncbi:MAG: 2'-5' RNA ligase family protein [Lachnospiraceae bacterium]|nr:2'-5' RNA ligase family protein [Lachnospiraceae bacterium]
MSLRTIMIFPQFDNVELIDQIRDKYDPLADLVRPHITLVFPFESPMSKGELAEILEKRLQAIEPFALELCGISKQEDTFGNYLFLDVIRGGEEISQIHRILYENEFKEFDKGYPYIPHMTIGKLPTPQELDDAYDAIKNESHRFLTEVQKISVEMIGVNEQSIIVIEKQLK